MDFYSSVQLDFTINRPYIKAMLMKMDLLTVRKS